MRKLMSAACSAIAVLAREGIDFFVLPDQAVGLDDTDFGKALPEGSRNSGPGDGCGYGVDSYKACVLGG